MAELKATPAKSEALAWLAAKLQGADEFARKPFGYENPPVALLSDLLGVPGMQKTLERVAYGEPLTSGRGMTTRMRPETEEALLSAPPAVGALGKMAGKGAMAAGQAGERLAERVIPDIMERGGKGAELLQDLAQGTQSNATVYHGSPFIFDKFKAPKFYKDQNGKYFGVGTYVSESPKYASGYRGASTGLINGQPVGYPDSQTVIQRASLALNRHKGDMSAAIEELNSLPHYLEGTKLGEMYQARNKETLEYLLSGAPVPKYQKVTGGALYKIDIPDEFMGAMLERNTPVSQQSDAIKRLAEKYMGRRGEPAGEYMGSDLMRDVDVWTRPGTDALRNEGVFGIHHTDTASSLRGEEPISNYVVLPGNQKYLKVLERDDTPLISSEYAEGGAVHEDWASKVVNNIFGA